MALIGIILGLLPSFAWLFFYLKEDLHPEPKKLLVWTFLMGAASAILALIIQIIFNCIIFSDCGRSSSSTLTVMSVIIFATVEELFKFGGAYYSVRKNPAFNEPVDAMIYMVVAAMGFAAVENLGAISFNQPNSINLLSNIFEITSLRFVGATLLHSLTSSVVGYYWAKSIREFESKKTLIKGLILASGLHALFNYLIINYGSITYSLVFVLIVGFFVLNDFEKLRKRAI